MVRLTQDTSPEAERVLVELWRKATPAQKFAVAFDTTRALQEFLLAGLRERHPGKGRNSSGVVLLMFGLARNLRAVPMEHRRMIPSKAEFLDALRKVTADAGKETAKDRLALATGGAR